MAYGGFQSSGLILFLILILIVFGMGFKGYGSYQAAEE